MLEHEAGVAENSADEANFRTDFYRSARKPFGK